MTVTGRNQPCPCGSGKKYKKCCHQHDRAASRSLDAIPSKLRPPVSATLPYRAFGLAGEEHNLVMTHVRRDGREPSPNGRLGNYDVTFVLRRPDAPVEAIDNVDFDGSKHIGTSHLAISTPALRFDDPRLNTEETRIKIDIAAEGRPFVAFANPNRDGYMSDVTMTISAESFNDASIKAQLMITPIFSSISALNDIPLVVSHISMREQSSEVVHRTVVSPFPVVAGVSIPGEQTAEARTLVNSYRDALNSNDPNWRFLCFSRIVEQLWKWQIARISAGETLAFDLEGIRIPSDDLSVKLWVASAFPAHYSFDDQAYVDIVPTEARGMTTNGVIKEYTRPIRDDIAHGLFDRGLLPPTKNDVAHSERVRRWLPMLRCIARVHLRAVFGFP